MAVQCRAFQKLQKAQLPSSTQTVIPASDGMERRVLKEEKTDAQKHGLSGARDVKWRKTDTTGCKLCDSGDKPCGEK